MTRLRRAAARLAFAYGIVTVMGAVALLAPQVFTAASLSV